MVRRRVVKRNAIVGVDMSEIRPVGETAPLAAVNGRDGAPFLVVGVGASAGGLEAISDLLKALPPDPGMAFLFVVHLDPHQKSALAEILSGTTPMPVKQAAEGMAIETDHVYLIPPASNMAL